ncbi:hypothetical protein KSP39_PZI001839 [Platanthera zijinensis]|uniref:Uncharacterized protein n=1 Tax=Platanthera zijinensis TaxID=2320716 RepID=A0AAP0GDZ2_9ASPA
MQLAEKAVDPFQFLAKILCNHIVSDSNMIPVTQDASASAYQIMSSLLLHHEMARVLPSLNSRKKIADVYMSLLGELKSYFSRNLDKDQYSLIESL